METAEKRIAQLASTFASMRGRAGIMEGIPPWNAEAVDSWAASSAPSHGQRVTAQFLLAVWDPAAQWNCGQFDLMEALRVWDQPHRDAFLRWAADPWWP